MLKRRRVPISVLLAFLILALAVNANAVPIDFETIPGFGIPTEGLKISTQFLGTEGVIFSLENGGKPLIAKVGGPTTAFWGPPNHTMPDTPASGQNVGSFFLTDDGTTAGLSPSPLIVTYAEPTAAASGVIMDIDLTETFTIHARDISGTILDTITLNAGDPNTGDGIATPWSFDIGTNNIYSIRFAGTRTLSGGFGLAFDNFDAHSA